MSAIARRPLLVVSLAVTSVALLGFLWHRRRKEEYDENCSVLEPPEFVFSDAAAREVSVKLESLKRSRLENIEEEDKLPEEEQPPATADLSDAALKIAADQLNQTADEETSSTDSEINKINSVAVCVEEQLKCSIEEAFVKELAVEVEQVTGRPTREEEFLASSSVVFAEEIRQTSNMTEKEADGPASQEQVPDIQEALKVCFFFFQRKKKIIKYRIRLCCFIS